MLQSELSDLLDGAVTARTSRKSSERRQLRAITGHLEPTEFRILLELVEQRSRWLEYEEANERLKESWDPAGFFPLSYETLRENLLPRRKDAVSRALSKEAVRRAMNGLVKGELIQRQRSGDGDKYWYRLELNHARLREPVDGDAARHDVRVMMSEARLGATPLMVMAQLRYLANDGHLALDRKQIEQATGFSHKTVNTTLEGLLPEALGSCAGLGKFSQDNRIFNIEFKTADTTDFAPLLIKPKPFIFEGFPRIDDGGQAETIEDDEDPTPDSSFEDPRWHESLKASTKEVGDLGETSSRHGTVAEDELSATRASRSADTRRSAQASPGPLPTSPRVPTIVVVDDDNDNDARFAVKGEMPEDRTVEDEFSDADLPEELLR